MKVTVFIALCAIFGTAHSYHSLYWVVHTGICKNSHGFTFHCVHYNNCRRTFFNPYPRGQSKVCGAHWGSIIMCCVEEDEDYEDELLPPKVEDYDSHNFASSGYYPGNSMQYFERPNEPHHDNFNPANFLDHHRNVSSSVVMEMNRTQVLPQDMKPGESMKETMSTDDSLTTQKSTTKQESFSQSTQSPKPVFTSSPLFDIRKANITPIVTALNKLKDKEPIPNKLNVPINHEVQEIIPISLTTNVLNETSVSTIESSTQITADITNVPFTSPPLEDIQETHSTPNKLQENAQNPNRLKLLIDNPEEITLTESKIGVKQNGSPNISTEVPITSESIETTTASINQNLSMPITPSPSSAATQESQSTARIIGQNLTLTEVSSFPKPVETTTMDTQMELETTLNLSIVVPLQNVPVSPQVKPEVQGFTIRTSNMEEGSTQDVEFQLPYYMPSPENRTSLRICRSLYQGVTREDAWNFRTMNKVQLGYGNETSIEWLCTGSLISERYLLTAAHCRFVNGTEPARYARVGDSRSANPANNKRLQNFTIEEFIPHPRYNFSFLQSQNDIAVVRLNASATFTDFVRPGCLSTKWDLASIPLWLLSVVPITFVHITTPRCRSLYNDTQYISDISQGCAVTDSYFFCQYDHGAPFVFINTDYEFGYFPEIVGIASYGNPCGDRPAVSTRVLPYVPWIEGIVWPNQ